MPLCQAPRTSAWKSASLQVTARSAALQAHGDGAQAAASGQPGQAHTRHSVVPTPGQVPKPPSAHAFTLGASRG